MKTIEISEDSLEIIACLVQCEYERARMNIRPDDKKNNSQLYIYVNDLKDLSQYLIEL